MRTSASGCWATSSSASGDLQTDMSSCMNHSKCWPGRSSKSCTRMARLSGCAGRGDDYRRQSGEAPGRALGAVPPWSNTCGTSPCGDRPACLRNLREEMAKAPFLAFQPFHQAMLLMQLLMAELAEPFLVPMFDGSLFERIGFPVEGPTIPPDARSAEGRALMVDMLHQQAAACSPLHRSALTPRSLSFRASTSGPLSTRSVPLISARSFPF